MVKKVVPIDYTSRDFESIKKDLLSYVKRYYPKTYKDFNEASFGSMMMDLVSYVGDSLNFYLDYNANESFLKTSLEYENVLNHAKQLGFKYNPNRSSVGIVDIYMPVPSKDGAEVAPDVDYLPKLLKGSTFSTRSGNIFTLNENVDFYAEEVELIADKISADDGSATEWYILKAQAQVVSGEQRQALLEVEDYKRFLKLDLPDTNICEVIKVLDAEGNEYFEVDYLSQNTVYKSIINLENGDKYSPSIMKAYPVPRRFVTERDGDKTFVVFGYGSESEIKNNVIVDPSEVAMKIDGKNYISNLLFDPTVLVSSDKFGVTPVDTTLTVTYRINTIDNVNASVGSLNIVNNANLEFRNEHLLDTAKTSYMSDNFQVYNEEPINGDISVPTSEEIKRRSTSLFASQGRAVTIQDYVSSIYAMPSNFGSVKRCAVYRDNDDFRRNINMYVISEDSDTKLQKSSSALKENLRTWLNSIRMISDSIDILDAIIMNLGIDFEIIAQTSANKNTVYSLARQKIFEAFSEIPPEIGEHFYVSEVFKILKEIDEVLDVVSVTLRSISGENYSDYSYGIDDNMSPEGRVLYIPNNSIWEVKYLQDVKGMVR